MPIQILPSNKQRSLGQSLAGGIAENLGPAINQFISQNRKMQEARQENEALKRMGLDAEGLSPELKKQAFIDLLQGKASEKKFERERMLQGQQLSDKFNAEQALAEQKFNQQRLLEAQAQSDKYNAQQALLEQEYNLKGGLESRKQTAEAEEKNAPFVSALNTLKEMRSIIKTGNLGVLSGAKGIISPKTRKDRAKYTQLGKSLIAMASTIPIRNQKEFETLAHDLYDPSNTDATNEGILDAMEQIIKQNMSAPQRITGVTQKPSEQFPGVGRADQQRQPLADIWK